jgi:hypothetical protein
MSVAPALDPEIADRLSGDPMLLKALSITELPEIRSGMTTAARQARLSDAVERSDVTVAGQGGDPGVVLRIHRPKEAAGPLPCIYTIHGGGLWVLETRLTYATCVYSWITPPSRSRRMILRSDAAGSGSARRGLHGPATGADGAC